MCIACVALTFKLPVTSIKGVPRPSSTATEVPEELRTFNTPPVEVGDKEICSVDEYLKAPAPVTVITPLEIVPMFVRFLLESITVVPFIRYECFISA